MDLYNRVLGLLRHQTNLEPSRRVRLAKDIESAVSITTVDINIVLARLQKHINELKNEVAWMKPGSSVEQRVQGKIEGLATAYDWINAQRHAAINGTLQSKG